MNKQEKHISQGLKTKKKIDKKYMKKCCPICLENMKKEDIIIPNFCRHEFCFDCLIKWSTKNAYCPLCRTFYMALIDKQSNHILPVMKEDTRERNLFFNLYVFYVAYLNTLYG